MGKIKVYSSYIKEEEINEDDIKEKLEHKVGGHRILVLKLKDGREFSSIDGFHLGPEDYGNFETNIRESLVKKMSETLMSPKEAREYLIEELPHLATTEGQKLLLQAYIHGIKAYTHKTMVNLLLDGTITGIPGRRETKYGVNPGGAITG